MPISLIFNDFWPLMTDPTRDELLQDLQKALQNRELILNYQPIIDLTTGLVAGFEALMRWRHPTRGVISPGMFIPLLEETGLIVPASHWALKEACHALKRIEGKVGRNKALYMSVNFTTKDFSADRFMETMYDTISISDVLPGQIQLEISEQLFVQTPETAFTTLDLCRQTGIKIALDEFEGSAESLARMGKFPITALKIDRDYIRAMGTGVGATDKIKKIIAAGKAYNMALIAEGVETEKEAFTLRDLGCGTAQGYFFSKPVTEREVSELILSWQLRKPI